MTDREIQILIDEPKKIVGNLKITFKTEKGHRRFEKELESESGNIFKVFIRQNTIDQNDFSIGLVFRDKNTGKHTNLFS